MKSFNPHQAPSRGGGGTDLTTSLQQMEKIERITRCLERRDVDLWELRELALTRGGLINAEMRRKAWHKLVGLDRFKIEEGSYYASMKAGNSGFVETIDPNAVNPAEMDLIRRDVGRSVLFRYKPRKVSSLRRSTSLPELTGSSSSLSSYGGDSDESEEGVSLSTSPMAQQRWNSQNLLASVIISALSYPQQRPEEEPEERLHYYQGFHDVASVFLFNLRTPSLASAVLRRIAKSHLRDSMQETFKPVTTLLDMVMFPLIQEIDEEMHDFLVHSEVEVSVFVGWLITWFAHDIHDEEAIGRLFDAFLVSHPLMPLYVAVSLVVHPLKRQKIFCSECDPAMVQMTIKDLLSGVSTDWNEGSEVTADGTMEDVLTFQDLIDDAIAFMRKVSPKSLLSLSKRYEYGINQPILKRASGITMLRTPPSWSLASTAPSDSVQRRQKRSRHRGVSKKYLLQPAKPLASKRSLKAQQGSGPGVLLTDRREAHIRAKVASGISLLITSEMELGSSNGIMGMFGRVLGILSTSTRRKRIEFGI